MPTKHICVLANSVKFSDRCIAGMEVTPTAEKKWHLVRKWIRPISHREGGAINCTESSLSLAGHQPALLDILEIDLLKEAQVEGQPEDWLINPTVRWKHCGRFNPAILDKLIETPENLWLEEAHHPDRVSPQYLRETTAPSLYLIRPETFQIYVRQDTFNGKRTKKRRGIFTYRGIQYDLGLTDPKMDKKYLQNLSTLSDGPVKGPEKVLALCISLTPVFQNTGFHYKLVAAVFE